ncbi:DUF1450 domain-containing protein [Sporolactobacillus nakayamae]|uniref:Uncharacterized protein YuzB, UPF0349 family n=1 Tax=Sporolactobacillus nakayamae TaxID=269670 RepID=A0A1I2Q0E6_9BACL|nr:DUF1450 domain-containing protein [Sporolactobacillus nakayamae]SFG21814.1 Uncharacterized protein YuzB, UPF0349 family [Sporolactobacillus nakayamae]
MNEGLGLITIEVCDYGSLTVQHLEKIARHPEVAVMNYDCLNVCGMCSLKPFAMVNGQRVFANTIDACLEKIEKKVDEELNALQ